MTPSGRGIRRQALASSAPPGFRQSSKAATGIISRVSVRLPISDTAGHEAAPGSHACASTNAGLDPHMATHLLFAVRREVARIE